MATQSSYAAVKKENVNVLSWWGYLDYPELIQEVEDKCNVRLTHDNYYSNDEFLHRWQGHQEYYGVIIFSDTIYGIVKPNLPGLTRSTLWQQSLDYHPVIKAHYLSKHYPHNVVYFSHALTGFLWNPKNIAITQADSVMSIFKKAKDKLVVIMDDPIEAKELIASAGVSGDLTTENFQRVIQNANVYVTNNYSQIYKKPDFAFSYSWSGEAVVDLMAANKQYQFLIHPKLSYISTDLLAQTSNSRGATCVARELSGRGLIDSLQRHLFYLSPYGNNAVDDNQNYTHIYNDFIGKIRSIKWLESVDIEKFEKLDKAWQLIKISLNSKNNENK